MKTRVIFTLIICLFLSINTSAYAERQKRVEISKEKLEAFKQQKLTEIKVQKAQILQRMKKAQATSVLFEDFEKFTAGSEAQPDGIDLTDLTSNYDIPSSYTLVPAWSGYGVYQAGGKAYLGIVPFQDETTLEEYDDTGYLDTPMIDLSANNGDVSVSFKARSESSEGDMILVICIDLLNDNDTYDFDFISSDWNTYHFEFEGIGSSYTFLEFYALEAGCFLDDIEISSGSSRISAPVALPATDITTSGFTANWQAVDGAVEYDVYVYTKEITDNVATDLIISEYAEGKSNDRAIEIFNGTGQGVDLSNYSLKQALNGTGWAQTVAYTLPLSGTLPNNSTYLIINEGFAAFVETADLVIKFHATNQGGRVMSYTGNDAMGLFKNDVLIDVVGDPNSKDEFGVDLTLIRASDVNSPANEFNEDEWFVEDFTYVDDLGMHEFDDESIDYILTDDSPYTTTGTSLVVSNLTEDIYYYMVTALDDLTTSNFSNEIEVVLSPAGVKSELEGKVFMADGHLILPENITSEISIYNIAGVKIGQYTANTTHINLTDLETGVYVIKIGSETIKVMK